MPAFPLKYLSVSCNPTVSNTCQRVQTGQAQQQRHRPDPPPGGGEEVGHRVVPRAGPPVGGHPLQGLVALLLRQAERREVQPLARGDVVVVGGAAQATLHEVGARGAHATVAVEDEDRTHGPIVPLRGTHPLATQRINAGG